jgi:hypothetical membrane protein
VPAVRHDRGPGAVTAVLTVLGPTVLVLGELAARRAQPPGSYDPVTGTVSTLAGRSATAPWLMAGTFVIVGLVYVGVAVGLASVAAPGRGALAAGALGLVGLAFLPQPAAGTSVLHIVTVFVGAAAFGGWPLALAVDPRVPTRLRREAWAVLALTGTEAAWWGEQAAVHGSWLGVAERVMLLTVTSWPIRVALVTTDGERRPGVAVGVAGLALIAPAVFLAGLLAAQAAYPGADAGDRSLSSLAAGGGASGWIMTSTLALAGVLSAAVAIGLRGLPVAARVVLGAGGALLVLAAAVPQPVGGTSPAHMVTAGLAWAGFVAWPLVLACSRDVGPRLRRESALAGGVLVVLAAWFAAQLVTDGSWYAASQRVLLVALAVWPARVALAAVRRRPAAGSRPPWTSPTPSSSSPGPRRASARRPPVWPTRAARRSCSPPAAPTGSASSRRSSRARSR